MPIDEYFAATYSRARDKFIAAASAEKSDLFSYTMPGHSGPQNEPLVVDVARIGPSKSRSLLMIVSGVHGVEGFCGSGCEVGYFANRLFETLPPGTGALLVHALNPFGFAWLRRVNESNVDVNRNFRDFSRPAMVYDAYSPVHKFLVPDDWNGEKKQEADAGLQEYIDKNGMKALQAVVSLGQYSHPDGLFYGGAEESWSNRTFQQILSDHVSPDTESISAIDLHTGLGPPGYGEPIHLGPQGEDFQRALDWFGPSVKSTSLGDSVSTPVTGSIADGIREFLPHARTTYIALEFGTVPVLKVLAALRADNWLHMISKQKSSFAKQFGDQMRNAFFVDELWWKAVVFGRFADLSLRAARGLASCNIRGHTSGLLESRP